MVLSGSYQGDLGVTAQYITNDDVKKYIYIRNNREIRKWLLP